MRAVAAAWSVARRFLEGMTGQTRYAAYLAHERASHPDRTPLDERAFWREVYRAQDAEPGSRCC
ncbi:hypothetical protein GCM10022219_03020 [Microbacterium oryzae]|uniref:DUF466 domain-containing protein n=1 Tax=Microbacterium oryzae TaxID=743009 RepID=A0A6I6DXV2_9MICO|nr:YbdD/YjiX family protein [Microbacterium oryzae]QGU26469.1 DUF466 domain-containing protein [Microbacterium oryzae]